MTCHTKAFIGQESDDDGNSFHSTVGATLGKYMYIDISYSVLVTLSFLFSSAVGVKSVTRRRSATTVITKPAVAVAWVSPETGCSARTPMTARRTHATPRMPWGAPMGTVVCVTSPVPVSRAGQHPTAGFLLTTVTRIAALLLVSKDLDKPLMLIAAKNSLTISKKSCRQKKGKYLKGEY